MLHDHLHRPTHRATRHTAIIQHLDISPRNDLAEPAVLRVADLDKVRVEEQDVGSVEGGALGLADELHDDAAADVAVLVDVDGALLVAEDKVRVGEAEHAERVLALQALGDGGDVLLLEVRHGPGLLLVEGEDLEALGGADGEGGVEEVDAVAVGRDVELVVLAEELGRAALEHARLLLRRLLVHGLEHLERRRQALLLLVEDERAVLHLARGEEADVT